MHFNNRESIIECSAVDHEIAVLAADASTFPDSIAPDVANYLYQLIMELSPQIAVEIGCCKGFSTLHIGKALLNNQKGKLVSFDLAPQEAEQRIRRAGLQDVVTFVTGNSAVQGKRYFDLSNPCIDFLFIDGDHTRRGCFRDAEVFLPLLKVGGVMVLHDIYPEHCGWLGPRYLIELLKGSRSCSGSHGFSINEISDLDVFGICVCRKMEGFSLSMNTTWLYEHSRLAQFIEIANFEGKRSMWEIVSWGFSKWRRVACHW